jgi:hypothetical protein
MSKRITKSDLTALVSYLNTITNNPADPYTKGDDGTYRANLGNYHLSGAYGGHALHQMANDGGGIRDVLHSGHVPARDLYDRIHAYIRGIEYAETARR